VDAAITAAPEGSIDALNPHHEREKMTQFGRLLHCNSRDRRAHGRSWAHAKLHAAIAAALASDGDQFLGLGRARIVRLDLPIVVQWCQRGRARYDFRWIVPHAPTVMRMNDIVRWLHAFDLGDLQQIFEAHKIDLTILPYLTEQDLKDLGISLGERVRLQAAIANLAVDMLASPMRQSSGPTHIYPPISASMRNAERRQLTVMFCDLVGSSALATKLDPEDLNVLVSIYRDACAKPIEKNGGFISRFVGDGILACFGYPQAHEDDAERAIWAGLEVVQGVKMLKPGNECFVQQDPLAVRIGIGTGVVLVGDINGHGQLERNAIIGEAPNLAARLQGLSRPNCVVIDTATQQLAGRIFEYRDLGNHVFKGFAEAQVVWEVIGESGLENRFEALRVGDTPVVGRVEEMEFLSRSWDQASAGQGQVAVLTGEAGIGKSHLAAAFRRQIDQGWQLGFHCSPRLTSTRLHPITRKLERLAGFDREDTDAERWHKLTKLIESIGWSKEGEELPLLGDLLGLKEDLARPLPPMTPREWRARTLEVIQRWLETIAVVRPLLLTFEDIQWMDASTWQLFESLVVWSAEAKVLILATLRTENTFGKNICDIDVIEKSPWRRAPHVTLKELAPFSEGDARKLISVTARNKAPPDGIVAGILARADGIPLYVEELTRSLAPIDPNEWRQIDSNASPTARTLPTSLNNALAARLDRTGPAREIAQVASVIGREFSARLLFDFCQMAKEHFDDGLDQLLAAGIIKPAGSGRDPTYVFRHALIQNAAYGTLLKRRRRELHLGLAEHLERERTTQSYVADEVLAEHYESAGALREAIATRKRAAKTAIERGAQVEAVNLLETAISTLANVPDDSERRQLELELTMELATALGAVRSYAPEVEKQYLRARDLCIQLDRADLRFNVEFGLTISHFVRGDLERAHSYAVGLFEHARQHPKNPLVDAYLANGMIRTQQGRFEEARDLLSTGVALTRPELDQPHFFTHGLNPGVYCSSYLANVLAYMGRASEALDLMERTLALARTRASNSSHMYSYVSALAIAGRVYMVLRDGAAVSQRSKDLIEFARRHHYFYFESIGKLQQSWASTTHGSEEAMREGAQKMSDGLAGLARAGTGVAMRSFYAHLADVHTRLGDKAAALADLCKAEDEQGFGAQSWDAEIERVRGEALRLAPEPDPSGALRCFQAAVCISRKQGARAFELRAACSEARLLLHIDRAKDALDLLADYTPIDGPITVDEVEVNQLAVECDRHLRTMR
jgi:class 3 adenylate cyclase/tetratricopeptide (TPR) repeat protein